MPDARVLINPSSMRPRRNYWLNVLDCKVRHLQPRDAMSPLSLAFSVLLRVWINEVVVRLRLAETALPAAFSAEVRSIQGEFT